VILNRSRELFVACTAFVLFVSMGIFVSGGYDGYSYLRDECGSDETAILSLLRDGGYGSHVYSTAVDAEYKVCFKEMYGSEEGSFVAEFKDDCDNLGIDEPYLHAIDIHDISKAEGTLGSHVSLATSGVDRSELCIWHSGMKNASRVVEIDNEADRPETNWPDGEVCYLLGSLAKETDSHMGWSDWESKEYETWVCFGEDYNVDEYLDVDIEYNTTSEGSTSVTSQRDVSFTAVAQDDFMGVREIYIEVQGDDEDSSFDKACQFEDNPEVATCVLTTDNQPFDSLEDIDFKATAWSAGTPVEEGRGVTDSGDFTVCGFSNVEIGNDIVDGTTCNHGSGIRSEDCQKNQYAGFNITGTGECPPLFMNISASSTVDIDQDEIGDSIYSDKEPVLGDCVVSYGLENRDYNSRGEMDGIYIEDGLGAGDVPSGDPLIIEGLWDVGDIPYYCRGEVLGADEYAVYEHQDQQDDPVASPSQGIVIDTEESGDGVGGVITLDPLEDKIEFGVVKEASVEGGVMEEVYPMEVKNWNDRPVAVRISWDWKEWDTFSEGRYWFDRSFSGETSFDDIDQYRDDYGYVRSPQVGEDNYDIQLVLGGRNNHNRYYEKFALVLEVPIYMDSGFYSTSINMTRDENDLELVT